MILVHHTSSGDGAGIGAERAKGTVGKTLVAWCATKLLYENIEGETYVGRLSGESRGWGVVDWAVAYEKFSKSPWIIPWQDVGLKDKQRTELNVMSIIAHDLAQGMLYAKRLGKTMEQVAEEIGTDRSRLYEWASGEKHPMPESEEKIERWLDGLLSGKAGNRSSETYNRRTGAYKKDTTKASKGAEKGENVAKARPPASSHKPQDKTLNITPQEVAANCEKCPLKGQSRVDGVRGTNGIMIIGEAPSREDAKAGYPFTGKDDKTLGQLLAKAGIEMLNCSMTYVCLCTVPRKGAKKSKPVKKALDCCEPRLLAEIEAANPHTIILLGDTATSKVLPGVTTGRFHGKVLERGGRKYAVMYSPDAAHSATQAPTLLADFEAFPESLPVDLLGAVQDNNSCQDMSNFPKASGSSLQSDVGYRLGHPTYSVL
ncbi:uracil-DNA glycosylase family protein [Chloroflexota bacterium]